MELIILVVLLAVIAGAIGIATKNSDGGETSSNVGFDLEARGPFESTPSLSTSAKPARKASKKVSAKSTKETPAVSVKKGKPAKKATTPTPAPTTSKRAVEKAQPAIEVKATRKGKAGKRK